MTDRSGVKGAKEKIFRTLDLSNISVSGLADKIWEFVNENGGENKTFFFHCCSAWSADDIAKHGIKLEMSKYFANFSHGRGFYVSDDLEKVLVFGAEKYGSNDRVAILSFVFQEDPKKIHQGLDLSGPNQETRLRKVVSFFKNGASTRSPNLEDHGLEFDYEQTLQYITGPYCDFKGQGGRFGQSNVQIYPRLSQLCVRKTALKIEFEEALSDSIVIISGPIWETMKEKSKNLWDGIRRENSSA
jgi:hypothetical protein